MPVKIKVTETGHVKKPKLDGGQLTRIGTQMVLDQKARWAAHKNAMGQEAKPLSKKYVFIKKKIRGGGRVYRDNNLRGALLANFQLRKAINGEIRAEPTSRVGRAHANGAVLYEDMIGFSGPEQTALFKNVQDEYNGMLKSAWVKLRG